MSLDPSLKSASSLARHRNVLTRGERLEALKELEKWDETKSVFNLPKVGHRKQALAKAEKVVAADGAAPVAGAIAAKGAPAGKGAAAAKGAPAAKGAAGAKGAPAAKGAAAAKGAPAAKGKK